MNPLYILVAILIFGLLVIVHEFGHFITAKWSGIRVEEFAVGFPPRIASFQRGETTYAINLLPLGGYVKMPGENGEVTDENGNPDPRTFGAKPASKRALVLVAGVTMNFLLAIALFTAAEAVGTVDYHPVLKAVVAGSAAEQAGVRPGDTILSVDGHPTPYWTDMLTQVQQDVNNAPAGAKTVPVVLVVTHKGSTTPTTLVVNAPVRLQAPLGIELDQSAANAVHKSVPLWQAPIQGVRDIGFVAVATYDGVRAIVHGLIPASQAVQGPVGIVKTTGQAAAAISTIGWYPLLFLAGYLSLNLAVINILPIPGLDGGRLLFIVIEVLRRGKRVSPQREGLVHFIGLATLLVLVLLVTINDVTNLGK
jgi:regulator of sigma E protease